MDDNGKNYGSLTIADEDKNVTLSGVNRLGGANKVPGIGGAM